MIKKLSFLVLLIGSLVFTSCASKKKVVYFQDDVKSEAVFEQYVPKIQTSDMLVVNVSSTNTKAAEAFSQNNTMRGNQLAAPNVYTVNDDGSISLPFIGKVKVAGLTRTQAANLIKEELKDYILDASINVGYANFKVSVIGEVNSPGTFSLETDRITLVEAIALAGDLTIQGKRKNIMVIRETSKGKETYTVDITSKEVFNSPVYYLAQNDVVYVEPNRVKVQSSIVNYTVFLSVVGVVLSIITFATR